MRRNADVDDTGVHPFLWAFLGVIAAEHRARTGAELVITSMRRKKSAWPSRHVPPPESLCTAADFRRWQLDEKGAAVDFCKWLRERFGSALGVVLEPEELTADQIAQRGGRDKVAGHIHVQLKAPYSTSTI